MGPVLYPRTWPGLRGACSSSAAVSWAHGVLELSLLHGWRSTRPGRLVIGTPSRACSPDGGHAPKAELARCWCVPPACWAAAGRGCCPRAVGSLVLLALLGLFTTVGPLFWAVDRPQNLDRISEPPNLGAEALLIDRASAGPGSKQRVARRPGPLLAPVPNSGRAARPGRAWGHRHAPHLVRTPALESSGERRGLSYLPQSLPAHRAERAGPAPGGSLERRRGPATRTPWLWNLACTGTA